MTYLVKSRYGSVCESTYDAANPPTVTEGWTDPFILDSGGNRHPYQGLKNGPIWTEKSTIFLKIGEKTEAGVQWLTQAEVEEFCRGQGESAVQLREDGKRQKGATTKIFESKELWEAVQTSVKDGKAKNVGFSSGVVSHESYRFEDGSTAACVSATPPIGGGARKYVQLWGTPQSEAMQLLSAM